MNVWTVTPVSIKIIITAMWPSLNENFNPYHANLGEYVELLIMPADGRWQMGFNSAFEGLKHNCVIQSSVQWKINVGKFIPYAQ